MRHRKRRFKLSMKSSRRKATILSMAASLLKYQRITMGLARAKVARKTAERLITLSKTDTVAARRKAYIMLGDRDLVGKLFKEIGPLFKDRSSGYTRIIPLGFRRGDGAQMAILELTERKIVEKLPRKKKEKARKEEAAPETEAGEEPVKEAKKEESKVKPSHKKKPTLEEEKRTEKGKTEDKRMTDKKGFMKNLRGFFRRKTDM